MASLLLAKSVFTFAKSWDTGTISRGYIARMANADDINENMRVFHGGHGSRGGAVAPVRVSAAPY